MATVKETQKLTNAAGYYLSSTDNKYPGEELKTIITHHRPGSSPSKVSDTWFSNFNTYVIREGSQGRDSFGLQKAGEEVAGNWSADKLKAFIRASGLEKQLRGGGVTTILESMPREALLMTLGALLKTDRNGGWSGNDIKGEGWQKDEIDKWATEFDQHYNLVSKAIESAASQGGISSAQLENTFNTIFGEDGYSAEAASNLLSNDNFQLQTAVGSTLTAAATPEPVAEDPVPDPNAEPDPLTPVEATQQITGNLANIAADAAGTAGENIEAGDDDLETAGAGAEQVAEAAEDTVSIENAYLGGEVDSEVANALGWKRSSDGKSWEDPRTNTTYYLDEETGLLNTKEDGSGDTAYTEGMSNFEEYDFASQYNDVADEFLYGSSVNSQNFAEHGFTDNGDNTYTGPNGEVYTLGADGTTLMDSDGDVLRTQGFMSYQSDLADAGKEYTDSMTTLRGEYSKAFQDYDSELRPRIATLDANTADLQKVAADASSPDYYNRLSGLYYDQARDEVNTSSRGAQESLNAMYANAGLDPSSPAYTKAMMDLQDKRAQALVSSRRQAIIDSHKLGSDMLSNRGRALSAAQSGIVGGMNALSGLYDVRVKGLDVDKDMISTIYGGKQKEAEIGISGINTIANTERDKVSTNEKDFTNRLNLTTGLNTDTLNAGATSANTSSGMANTNFNAAMAKFGIGRDFTDWLRNQVLTKGATKLEFENTGLDPAEYFSEEDYETLGWDY